MAKNSFETRLRVVHDVLDHKRSIRSVSRAEGLSKSVVQRWVKRYQENGMDGLSVKGGRYSGDFKLNAVEYIQRNHISVSSAAAHFGISETAITLWMRIYNHKGFKALATARRCKMSKDKSKKPEEEKQTNEDLLAEVKRLRMENEYLKKLNALVQAREESAKKTK